MKYEKPIMAVITFEAEDVITLSVGNDNYDPTIKGKEDDPWAY